MSDEILKALEELKDGQARIEKNLGAKIERVGAQVHDLNQTVGRFMGSFKDQREWSTRTLVRVAEAADVDLSSDPPPKVVAR